MLNFHNFKEVQDAERRRDNERRRRAEIARAAAEVLD